MIRALAAALSLAAACGSREAPAAASLSPERRAAAEALLVRFECTRCHDGLEVAAAPLDESCVTCHREIVAGVAQLGVPDADVARWRLHVRSLLATPSLARVGPLLRRDWVTAFLSRPHDVRPHLPATMPRLALAPDEAALIAEYLVPDEAMTPPRGGDVAHGRALYDQLACGACHRLAGTAEGAPPAGWDDPAVPASTTAPHDAYRLAPDLSFAAVRLQPGRLEAWLAAPPALVPGTLMPALAADRRAARDLAAYLLSLPPPPVAASSPAETRLPVLAREVGFDEVAERVFRKVCWHCHAAPFYAQGDGGPGNTGGFGFAPRGLDLSSHEGVMTGAHGDDGRRRSIFTALPDGTPRLVALLMARRLEERGGEAPGLRGMPLGLPALSLEDIQLVETWIVQGRAE